MQKSPRTRETSEERWKASDKRWNGSRRFSARSDPARGADAWHGETLRERQARKTSGSRRGNVGKPSEDVGKTSENVGRRRETLEDVGETSEERREDVGIGRLWISGWPVQVLDGLQLGGGNPDRDRDPQLHNSRPAPAHQRPGVVGVRDLERLLDQLEELRRGALGTARGPGGLAPRPDMRCIDRQRLEIAGQTAFLKHLASPLEERSATGRPLRQRQRQRGTTADVNGNMDGRRPHWQKSEEKARGMCVEVCTMEGQAWADNAEMDL
eukprot:gene8355-biopygen3732